MSGFHDLHLQAALELLGELLEDARILAKTFAGVVDSKMNEVFHEHNTQDEMRSRFDTFDTDHSGDIDPKEFKEMCRQL